MSSIRHKISNTGAYPYLLVFFILSVIIVFHLELLIYTTDLKEKEVVTCGSKLNIIYSSNVSDSFLVASLFNKWMTSPNDQSTILSVPRIGKGSIVSVIPYIERKIENLNNLLKTLSSISIQTEDEEKLNNIVAILFTNRSDDEGTIKTILTKFIVDIQIGFLQLIKIPQELYVQYVLPSNENVIRQKFSIPDDGDDIRKEKFRKFLHMVTAVSQHFTATSEYILLLDNDVEILSNRYLTQISNFVDQITQPWSVIDFSDHLSEGFTGKLLRTADEIKFTYFFNHLLSQKYFHVSEETMYEANLDYLHLMYQSNFVVFRPCLIMRRPQWSLEDGKLNIFTEFVKSKWKSDDPPGVVVTNMQSVDFRHSPLRAYGSLPGQFFQAKSPKVGDWFVIVFDNDVMSNKVIIELGPYNNASTKEVLSTGFHPSNFSSPNLFSKSHEKYLNHTSFEAIFEVSPKLLKLNQKLNEAKCADYLFLGTVSGSTTILDNLEDRQMGRPTKCIKLTLTNVPKFSDLIIRQIAVFSSNT